MSFPHKVGVMVMVNANVMTSICKIRRFPLRHKSILYSWAIVLVINSILDGFENAFLIHPILFERESRYLPTKSYKDL